MFSRGTRETSLLLKLTCMSSTENSDVLSIMADSGDESFEGFDSEDIREAEKRLASKMNEIRSTAGSAVHNDNEQGPSTSTAKPSSACKKGGKRKSSSKNATKAKKNKKADVSGNDITNAILNMDTENIDKFKEMMGINDIIGCIYNLQKERLDQLEQESVDLDVNNNEHEVSSVNDDFDFFMNDKESVEQDKDQVDNDWDIPEWFSSDKKGKNVDDKLANMVNTLCTKEGETEKIIESHPRPANCTYLLAPRVNPDIWNIMPKSAQSRDSGFQAVQKTIATGIVPLLKIAEMSKSNENLKEVRNLIKQAVIVLCNSVYQLSQKRRFLLRKILPNKFSDICNATQPVTEFLFGSDIQKKIKELSDFDKYKSRDKFNRGAYNNAGYRGRRNFSYNYYYGRGRGSNRPFLGGRTREARSDKRGRREKY